MVFKTNTQKTQKNRTRKGGGEERKGKMFHVQAFSFFPPPLSLPLSGSRRESESRRKKEREGGYKKKNNKNLQMIGARSKKTQTMRKEQESKAEENIGKLSNSRCHRVHGAVTPSGFLGSAFASAAALGACGPVLSTEEACATTGWMIGSEAGKAVPRTTSGVNVECHS
jgi:hypothetical protein